MSSIHLQVRFFVRTRYHHYKNRLDSANYKCEKKGEIFKIVVQLDRELQNRSYKDFQANIWRIDGREHFGTRYLRLYNEDKKLDFAVDLAKLDQKGTPSKNSNFLTKF